jgi:hypothetical protein
MKFRIVKYYERFKAQVLKDGEYVDIGSPTGYANVTEAKMHCEVYKFREEANVVTEFEL